MEEKAVKRNLRRRKSVEQKHMQDKAIEDKFLKKTSVSEKAVGDAWCEGNSSGETCGRKICRKELEGET
jgi:hypothetical protein